MRCSDNTCTPTRYVLTPPSAFQTVVVTAQSEASLPKDVDIKLQILHVADALRVYTPVPASGRSPRLSSIGLEFMDLCTKAIPRVSENRWFDIGAQFLIQAAVEEPREGNTPTDMLHQFSKFSAWTPSDRSRISKWMRVRQRYISELPGPGEFSSSRASLIEKFPFMEFKASVLGFLFDLMATLDAPLLIQLERGQVGQLSRAETQRLKERIGMH